jgi:hypothetical protein
MRQCLRQFVPTLSLRRQKRDRRHDAPPCSDLIFCHTQTSPDERPIAVVSWRLIVSTIELARMARANSAPSPIWVSWTSTRPLRSAPKRKAPLIAGLGSGGEGWPIPSPWSVSSCWRAFTSATTGYAVLVLFNSADCYERGRCVSAIVGVRVAPAHDEPRNELNSTERESTSGRSTNSGSAHLIRVFHDIGRTVSLLFLLTTRRPFVTQVEKGFKSGRQNMVSSEQKTVSIVFRAELTAVDEPAACAAL